MPKFERQVEIDAPVTKVWEALINPQRWPEWFPGVDSVTGGGPLNQGSRVQWSNEKGTGQASVVTFEPQKKLEVITQIGDDRDQHVFKLRPSGGFLGLTDDECTIEYTLDTLMGGGILGNFVAGGNPRDALRVKKAINLLRKMVENS